MEFVIGLVAMWAIAKARRVAVRADGVVDQALDAAVDRVGELVTSRLAGDSAVAQLEAEAADNGESFSPNPATGPARGRGRGGEVP